MSQSVPIHCRFDEAALTALVVALCLGGCASSHRAERYMPDAGMARQALETAMTAWQHNQGTSLLLDGQAVEVIDKHRRPGQVLREFNILGELSGDGGRWFEVELQLEQPAQTEHVRYIVVGINPLWIFRQQDYELLGHWDHLMPEDEQTARPQKTVSSNNNRSSP
jgi:hypothetical protein